MDGVARFYRQTSPTSRLGRHPVDELRGSLINDAATLNEVEVAGWYWCERLQVEPLDQPHDDLDQSLDVLASLAAAADSVERLGQHCFDRYPEFQPAAGAVAR